MQRKHTLCIRIPCQLVTKITLCIVDIIRVYMDNAQKDGFTLSSQQSPWFMMANWMRHSQFNPNKKLFVCGVGSAHNMATSLSIDRLLKSLFGMPL